MMPWFCPRCVDVLTRNLSPLLPVDCAEAARQQFLLEAMPTDSSAGGSCVACTGILTNDGTTAESAASQFRSSPYFDDALFVTPTISFARLLKLWYETVAWQVLQAVLRRYGESTGKAEGEAEATWRRNCGHTPMPATLSLREELLATVRTALQATLKPGVALTTQSEDVLVEHVVCATTHARMLQQAFSSLTGAFTTRENLTWEQIIVVNGKFNISALTPQPGAVGVPITSVVTSSISRASIFVSGRYRKLLRDMPQTPWFVGGQRVGSLSLQERITQFVIPLFFPNGIPEVLVAPGAVSAQTTCTAPRDDDDEEEGDGKRFKKRHRNWTRIEKPAAESAVEGDSVIPVHGRLSEVLSATALKGGARMLNAAGTAADDANPKKRPREEEDAAEPAAPASMFAVNGKNNHPEKSPFLANCERVYAFQHYRLSSSGREDVDVRMLGKGRPFILEIITPHRARVSDDDLKSVERAINDSDLGVEVEQLQYEDKNCTVRMARESEAKRKVYRCVVWSSRALSPTDPMLIELRGRTDIALRQKTPMRVLHRRALIERPRFIHRIGLELLNPHWLVVDLETSSGTYVKEFVHGDMGRTQPHLGGLLGSTCDIIQLDVLDLL